MKTMSKKLGAIVLALALCLSLCCSALAAETQTYSSTSDASDPGFSIVINPAYSQETYTAYKIFDVTYSDKDDEGNVSYSYTINSSSVWYTQVAAATDVFELTQIGDSSVYNVNVKDGVSDVAVIAVFSSVPEGATAAASGKAEEVINGDGSTGFTSLTLTVNEPGYYYITTSLGSVVTITTTNPTAEVGDKNTPPQLGKVVTNEDDNGTVEEGNRPDGAEDTASIGQKLEYVLTIDHAAHLSALCVHDFADDGLDYQSGSVKVYLNDYNTVVESTNYTLAEGCEDKCAFEIDFTKEFLDKLSDSDVIYITYEDVVTEENIVIHENDAWLTYGTNGMSVKSITDTYTYGFRLTKTDENNATLAGATFTLAYSDGSLVEFYYDEKTNTYIVHDAIDDEYSEEEITTEIKVGQTYIFGLEDGVYTLTETVAPDGYNKLASPVTITITADSTDLSKWTVTYTYDGTPYTGSGSIDDEGNITYPDVSILNNAGAILPGTGGIGTTIFYIIGGVLVVGAVVVLITRRRMSNEG